MSRLALDTNRYTDLQRAVPEVVDRLENAALVFLPFVVLAELRAGFAGGKRGEENEQVLRIFLAKPKTAVIYPDEQTTHHYAALYRHMREQGTPIPQNDLWLAALVLQHDLTLYTRDAHFAHLPQLRCI